MNKRDREKIGLDYAKTLAAFYRDLATELQHAADGLDAATSLESNFPILSRDQLCLALESSTVLKFIIDPPEKK